jgi:hypothetical protein
MNDSINHNDTDGFAPPTQPGIHMINDNGELKLSVSVRNPTPEPITLRTMSGKLFTVSLKEKGGDVLWAPSTGAAQAVTHWTLDAESRVTSHYTVPNPETARDQAQERIEDTGFVYDNPDDVTIVTGTEFPDRDEYDGEVLFKQAVDPDDIGIVQVEASLPTGGNYFTSLTRQFDLRIRPDRALDNELPVATRDAIDSNL